MKRWELEALIEEYVRLWTTDRERMDIWNEFMADEGLVIMYGYEFDKYLKDNGITLARGKNPSGTWIVANDFITMYNEEQYTEYEGYDDLCDAITQDDLDCIASASVENNLDFGNSKIRELLDMNLTADMF